MLFLGLGLFAAAVAFLRSRDWSAAEHRDNYQALNIVGRSLESWPSSVQGIARANLLPDRLEPPPSASDRERGGWTAAARLEHPDVGTIQVLYKLDGATAGAPPSKPAEPLGAVVDNCRDTAIRSVSIDPLRNTLTMEARLRLAELWRTDQELAVASSDIRPPSDYAAYVAAIDPGHRFFENNVTSGPCPAFRYRTAIPLTKIANIETNAPAFSNILLIDPNGNVVAALGNATLTVSDLKDFVVAAPEYRELVTKLLVVASRGTMDTAKDAEIRRAVLQAQRSAKPLDVDVAGKSYVAYFRPIEFEGRWNVPQCQPLQNAAKTDAPAGSASAAGMLDAPGTGCLLIGLVPQSELRARLVRLSPDLLTLFAILLAFALVLVPVTKLRFLGPAGDMSPLEVGAVVFGLVAAVAIVTLAALATRDALQLRAQARASLADVANSMAGQFDEELQAAITHPVWLPSIKLESGVPRASPAVFDNIDCRFADNSSVPVNGVASKQNDPPFWLIPKGPGVDIDDRNANFAWPRRELVIAFGEQGRAFPGYSSLANRCHAGSRSIIDNRAYFQRSMRGETDGTLSSATCSELPGLAVDRRYTIGAVRAQLDGLAKVVVVNRFWKDRLVHGYPMRQCGSRSVTIVPGSGGPRHGVVLQAFVMRSLLAAVMPRGMRYIVVDTSERQLPYLFGTDAHQIGVYSLAETLTSADARNAIEDVAYRSRHSDGKDAKPQYFAAPFEGMPQHFVAKALPGTPWVLLVYRPISDVDVRLARRVGWAAGIWWGFAIAGALAVLAASIVWKREIWLWLWPRPGNGKVMAEAGNAVLAVCAVALLALAVGFNGVVAVSLAGVGVPIVSVFVAWVWLTGRTSVPKDNEAAVDIRNGRAEMIVKRASEAWKRLRRYWPGTKPASPENQLPVVADVSAERQSPSANDINRSVPLLPSDERGFVRLGLGLLLALGAVPMCATWADSRADEIVADRSAEIAHREHTWKANREALAAIIRAYGLTDIATTPIGETARPTGTASRGSGNASEPRGRKWTGLYDFEESAGPAPVSQENRTTTTLRLWLGTVRKGVVRGCQADAAPPSHGYCVDAQGSVGLFEDTRPWLGSVWWPGAMAYLLVLLALVALLRSSCHGMNRALFGFGIPLEAVNYPGIRREMVQSAVAPAPAPHQLPPPPNVRRRIGALLRNRYRRLSRRLFTSAAPAKISLAPVPQPTEAIQRTERKPLLPDRAVVLNGPLALVIDLLGDADPLDLAQTDAKGSVDGTLLANQLERLKASQTVVVINLDIALKDPALRRQALTTLEALSDLVEKRWRTFNREDALGTEGHLVVMTDLSPLDRILQAYERELDESQADQSSRAAISRTEQIRWSRLFEDFTTYTLSVQAKFLWSQPEQEFVKSRMGATDDDQVKGVLELIKEVRFLPETVIHSLISPDKIPQRQAWTGKNIDSYPLQPRDYHDIYFTAVCDWALLVRPATKAAAVDFLRGVLIEHYQHLWAASSHAERVILDNLARGRVINIEAALAIRSLIRRGLVVLDPAARLVNLSFAEFVRQAEKPEALRAWRSEQPKGGWDKVARPLAFVLPSAIVILAVMAIMAGESLTTVLPIVLGAGPALLSTLISGRKPA